MMSLSEDHGRFAADLERLFVGKLAEGPARRLMDHVRECSPCRALYERYSAAEQALLKPEGGLTPWAQSRVSARLFAGAEPQAAAPSRSRAWMPALAMSAALGMVLLYPRLSTDDGLQSRSGGAALSPKTSLRVLRLSPTATGGFAVSDLSHGTVEANDRMKILYSNLQGWRRLQVSIYAGERLLLRTEPEEIQDGVEDQALGSSLQVGGDWPEGALRVQAVFSRKPTTVSERLPAEDGNDRAVRVVEATLGGGG